MSFAAARVETKIVISGENNAKQAVNDSAKGLNDIGESAGDAEKGLRGMKDILAGQLQGPLHQASELFGGIEAITQALPGTLGLAAAAVVTVAAGAFLLAKHLSESEAKVKSLGDSSTRALADNLHLSLDEAIKLQQAFEDIPAKLRPTGALLDSVRQRAEAMGLDGAAATAKFVAALDKGPEALKAFEREFGRLSKVSAELPDVADRLGLSRDALGIATNIGNEAERAKVAALQAVALERQLQASLAQQALLLDQASKATVVKSLELQRQSVVMEEQAVILAGLVRGATAEANALQAVVAQQKAATDATRERAGIAAQKASEIALLEAQAAVQTGKQATHKAQLNVLRAKGAEITRKEDELQADFNRKLVTEAELKVGLNQLGAEDLRNFGAKKALSKQQAVDATAANAKAQAALDAEIAASIRLGKTRIATAEQSINTLGKVHGLTLAQLAAEEQAELGKSKRATNTARGHEADKLAIKSEFAARRQQLDTAETENYQKALDENLKLLQTQAERSKAIAADTGAAVASAAKSRATSLASSLRAAGNDERADLVELQQAHVDYAAQRLAITDRITAAQSAFNDRDEDWKQLDIRRKAELSEALQKYGDLQEQVSARAAARQRERIAGSIEQGAAGPAALLRGMGGESAKVADALSGVASGAAQVARNWGDLGKAAPGAISAVGAVATAFVDGEREKAGILAIMETAAVIAAVAVQDYAGAAAHGAAAVLYGGIAVGAIGGSAGAAAGGGSAGGFAKAESEARDDKGGRGSATIININTPLTSRQDVAKGISSGLRSLGTTGYAKSKGA